MFIGGRGPHIRRYAAGGRGAKAGPRPIKPGLGWAVHTGSEVPMSYAATDGSYGATGASSGLIWIDPSLQLIRIYMTHHFGDGSLPDGNPVMNAAFPC